MAKRLQIRIAFWIALFCIVVSFLFTACRSRSATVGCDAKSQNDCESAAAKVEDETKGIRTCIWFDESGERLDVDDSKAKDFDVPEQIRLSVDEEGVGACLSYVKVSSASNPEMRLENYRRLVAGGDIQECRLLNQEEACESRNVTRALKNVDGNHIECKWDKRKPAQCVDVSDEELKARQALQRQIDVHTISSCAQIKDDGAAEGVCEDDQDPARKGWKTSQCRWRGGQCVDFPTSGTPTQCGDVKPVDRNNCTSGLLTRDGKTLNCAPSLYYNTPRCVEQGHENDVPPACDLRKRDVTICQTAVAGAPECELKADGTCGAKAQPAATAYDSCDAGSVATIGTETDRALADAKCRAMNKSATSTDGQCVLAAKYKALKCVPATRADEYPACAERVVTACATNCSAATPADCFCQNVAGTGAAAVAGSCGLMTFTASTTACNDVTAFLTSTGVSDTNFGPACAAAVVTGVTTSVGCFKATKYKANTCRANADEVPQACAEVASAVCATTTTTEGECESAVGTTGCQKKAAVGPQPTPVRTFASCEEARSYIEAPGGLGLSPKSDDASVQAAYKTACERSKTTTEGDYGKCGVQELTGECVWAVEVGHSVVPACGRVLKAQAAKCNDGKVTVSGTGALCRTTADRASCENAPPGYNKASTPTCRVLPQLTDKDVDALFSDKGGFLGNQKVCDDVKPAGGGGQCVNVTTRDIAGLCVKAAALAFGRTCTGTNKGITGDLADAVCRAVPKDEPLEVEQLVNNNGTLILGYPNASCVRNIRVDGKRSDGSSVSVIRGADLCGIR